MGSYSGQRRRASCVSGWIKFAFLGVIVSVIFQGALCEVEPTESQCRPYIEKALKEQHLEIDERNIEEAVKKLVPDEEETSPPTDELTDSIEGSLTKENEEKDNDAEVKREDEDENENEEEDAKTEEDDDLNDADVKDEDDDNERDDNKENEGLEVDLDETEDPDDGEETANTNEKNETDKDEEGTEKEIAFDDEDEDKDSNLESPIDIEIQEIEIDDDDDDDDTEETRADEDNLDEKSDEGEEENDEDDVREKEKDEEDVREGEKDEDVREGEKDEGDVREGEKDEGDVREGEKDEEDVREEEKDEEDVRKEERDEEDVRKEERDEEDVREEDKKEEIEKTKDKEYIHKESTFEKEKHVNKEDEISAHKDQEDTHDDDDDDDQKADEVEVKMQKREVKEKNTEAAESKAEEETDEEMPEEEELIKEIAIPENLRSRDHIDKILKLEDSGLETILEKTIDTTLKTLKGLYDNAIKPLEMLYKYRDLSNRHFGDPEIFSKPLVLFMGPWSGGKSSTINYLLKNEFSQTSLRTGAEPSPAYFNILMHGEEEEILDGTQLAADWTFSGLQKFGQSLLDRLKGIKLPNKLLEKVNIVEIPGILEIRKQVQRLFPFNDACQWFIDRADIIFLVYDPSKLDVGPETEAILDQLKGREYQTRIILNKADQVKPEELMRVQGTLIWNISPLMSSSEPPIMYSTSLWSLPYETGAPTRLLQAQERAFLKDLREAIDKRVENKIASARRFAVRVRNHAKMVDCYLTTYYNHKTIFGNRKKISDDIIEYPQKYHIYEGLSTLTNISRYDLPDPDVYRDFFKINPLYEFKKLSETCTYFRGCPINKLDVAIAYDLPELIGKYKKAVETAKEQLQKENS